MKENHSLFFFFYSIHGLCQASAIDLLGLSNIGNLKMHAMCVRVMEDGHFYNHCTEPNLVYASSKTPLSCVMREDVIHMVNSNSVFDHRAVLN
jgi:hypothetical protein